MLTAQPTPVQASELTRRVRPGEAGSRLEKPGSTPAYLELIVFFFAFLFAFLLARRLVLLLFVLLFSTTRDGSEH